MDGKQAALGEGERFEQQFIHVAGGAFEADTEVLAAVVHERRHAVREQRFMLADANPDSAPAPGPFRHKVAGERMVKL